MWLDPEFLKWSSSSEVASSYGEDTWRRPYQIWSHAERLLDGPDSEFARVDAITTIKRAIDYRIRMLNGIYDFRAIPVRDKPTDHLELLAFVGIARPLMVQQLTKIRNAVEHEDIPPPDAAASKVFLEFAWYFLKSTDRLVRQAVDSFLLYPPDMDGPGSPYWVSVEMGPDHGWIPHLRGWVKGSMVSNEERQDWAVINAERCESRELVLARLKDSDIHGRRVDDRRGINPDDVYFTGALRGPASHLKALLEHYVEVV